MRLNKFIAQHTPHSRRTADTLIEEGRVFVNGQPASPGVQVNEGTDEVSIDKEIINTDTKPVTTIMFHKPIGYVCSRQGQGSRTVYDLLPPEFQHLNLVGRLDKESSGLLLLTNDGELANQLTHPRYQKIKVYEIELDKPLAPLHQQMISDHGIALADGPSKLQLEKLDDNDRSLRVFMHEGRNRQIRRTFDALGYNVTRLHRTIFGNYHLDDLRPGQFKLLKSPL